MGKIGVKQAAPIYSWVTRLRPNKGLKGEEDTVREMQQPGRLGLQLRRRVPKCNRREEGLHCSKYFMKNQISVTVEYHSVKQLGAKAIYSINLSFLNPIL